MLAMELKFSVYHNSDVDTYNRIVVFNDNTNTNNYLWKVTTYIVDTLKSNKGFKWYSDIETDEFTSWLADKPHTIEDLYNDYGLECYYSDLFIDEWLDKLTMDRYESYEQLNTIFQFIELYSNATIDGWEDFDADVI